MPQLRILDFDIENRPLAYMGQDFTSGEITAIAATFIGEKKMYCWLLGEDSPKNMLVGFRELYDQADIVAGHFIRAHDLPIINGALVELGLPPLSDKLTSDSCKDLTKTKYISRSQENLAEMLGVAAVKAHMSNAAWREANRLKSSGISRTRTRVISDVLQNIAIREVLIDRNLLGRPKVWRSR